MNHLETLIGEYLEWKGFFVVKAKRVGRLAHGGFTMELDVVGYHPGTHEVIHYEPSTDADSWEKREARYAKKMAAAKKFIPLEVLPHTQITNLRHIAVFSNHPVGRDTLSGFEIQSINELMCQIKTDIAALGVARRAAIPENFPLLRTVQLLVSGY